MLLALLLTTAITTHFPVADLDNCRDTQECKLYCDIPANKPECWAFAESRVLGDATDSASSSPSAGLTFPIAELGNCANMAECKAYCDQEVNKVACQDFAEEHHLGVPPQAASMLTQAKTALGCTSLVRCKAYCDQPANQAQCQSFMEQFAPPLIKARIQTANTKLQQIEQALGCSSQQACYQLCKQNSSACSSILRSTATASGELQQQRQDLHADCKSVDECKQWCLQHPNLCPSLPKGPVNGSDSGHLKPPPFIGPRPTEISTIPSATVTPTNSVPAPDSSGNGSFDGQNDNGND